MKFSKTSLLVVSFLTVLSFSTFAADKSVSLKCGTSTSKTFSAVFNLETYKVTEARIRDNFFTSESLTCIGSSVDDLRCVGYVNGISDLIEVQTSADANGVITANYEVIRGLEKTGSVKCSVK